MHPDKPVLRIRPGQCPCFLSTLTSRQDMCPIVSYEFSEYLPFPDDRKSITKFAPVIKGRMTLNRTALLTIFTNFSYR